MVICRLVFWTDLTLESSSGAAFWTGFLTRINSERFNTTTRHNCKRFPSPTIPKSKMTQRDSVKTTFRNYQAHLNFLVWHYSAPPALTALLDRQNAANASNSASSLTVHSAMQER